MVKQSKLKNLSTCYLIGDGSLPIACSATFRRYGIRISGILPTGTALHAWGQANEVKVFPSLEVFNETASAVDYIFSLGNSIILPEKTLNFAKKICINYHDGPLPMYSGVNAPMWAILNGEKRHGITWHVMNKTVDTGDILLQRSIEISPSETTTTLNEKCYKEALSSFEELVDGIANNKLVPIRQDLSKRRYYPLHTKLFDKGFVDWNGNAEENDRIYRALSFIDHLGVDRTPNPTNNRLIYPYTNMRQSLESPPFVVESGKNIYVYDRHGREYIDGVSSLYNVSLGYDNQELISAAIEQFKKLPFYGSFNNQTNSEAIKLANRLSSIAPIQDAHVFFACSGSEANDTAVKFAWYYNNALNRTKKKIVLAFSNCYHGSTIGAASLTGPPSIHKDFDLPIKNIQHLPAPEHIYEGFSSSETIDTAIQEMEKAILSISPDRIAAFILEPVFSCPGVFIPSSDYLRKLEALLRKYDILLIADEIVTSFYRAGSMFRSQEIGICPDIITVSKGLAAAYQPISAVIISDKIFNTFLGHIREPDVFCHGFTYSAHPVAAAVANKAIEIYSRDSFKKNMELTSDAFKEKLLELYQFKFVKQVRQVGMIAGVEFDGQEIKAEQIVLMTRKKGLLLRSAGNTIMFAPPLIINSAQIDEIFSRLINIIKAPC